MHLTITMQPGQNLDTATKQEHVKAPDYPTLKALVGGLIQPVPHLTTFSFEGKPKRCIAYCNEEGQLKGLPPNPVATGIWKAKLLRDNPRGEFWYDPILYGPVVFVIKVK